MAAATGEELTLPLEDDPKCAECSQPIEEGSVLAFGNHIWHVDCFRCCKCSKVIDHDSNLLLLNDGMPICENCSYECSVCQKKIDDLAIMTGDESYHSECFRCRMCQRKIEDLVFAKTSQGIYCIACHNGRMAKNRKNKGARSSRDMKDKSLPSVPARQAEIPDILTSQDDGTASRTLVDSQTFSDETALPSPSRRPPAPPVTPGTGRTQRPKTTIFNDFNFDMINGNSQDTIPVILQDDRDWSVPAPDLERTQSRDPAVAPFESLDTTPQKTSVRERRRPTDAELRLPVISAPETTSQSTNGSHKNNSEAVPLSGTYSLFPPKSGDITRSQGGLLTPSTINERFHPKSDPRLNDGFMTGSPSFGTTSPAVPARSAERQSPVAQKVARDDVFHDHDREIAHPSSRPDVESHNQSLEEPARIDATSPEDRTRRLNVEQGLFNSKPSRHVSSKSLESSPAYRLVPDSPVTTFESDVSKAFNLSPQGKRNSQQSLNGTLERSGTISRLAGKMLKHKKSVSGSALTPGSPNPGRRKSTTEQADLVALQAELKVKSERILYLEASLAKVADAQTLESELEARKSLLAKVETQLVQTGAEHQSYLHHRHRISDVSIPLGEWKANVVADLDTTLKKTRDNLSTEIEMLLRQRSDLKRENDKLEVHKTDLAQEVSVLELRKANLVEMHESMLKQIQQQMEANKEGRSAGHTRLEQVQAHSPIRSPSLNFSETDMKVHSTTNSESDLALTPNAIAPRETLIEEEDEPMVESAIKRMSGERPSDMAAPKKFNLVKKTKKAFRWGRTPTNPDILLPQYNTVSSTNPSLTERTMSSSKSSDKLSTKSNSNGMFKRTWQSQQNLSSYLDPKLDDGPASVTTLFGNDLSKQAQSEGRQVPHIVTSCIKVIEARALDFEGLYRKSGGAGEMKSLIEAFEIANSEGDSINIPAFLDISAITSVLKQYLRKLPVPLVTFDNYEPFIGTAAIPNTTIRTRAIKEVLCDLPECHQETLRLLFRHLQVVSQHCGTNLMTSKNLAVVLGPSIIWDQAGEKEIVDMHEKNNCIQFCIEHAEEL